MKMAKGHLEAGGRMGALPPFAPAPHSAPGSPKALRALLPPSLCICCSMDLHNLLPLHTEGDNHPHFKTESPASQEPPQSQASWARGSLQITPMHPSLGSEACISCPSSAPTAPCTQAYDAVTLGFSGLLTIPAPCQKKRRQ